MTGCDWDLLGFGKNLDGSAGLVDTVLMAGEDLYEADGVAGTGTKVKPRAPGTISAIFGISEDGAMTEMALRRAASANYLFRGHHFFKGQAEILNTNQLYGQCNIPITVGDRLIASLTNAAAKFDAIFAVIGKNNVIPRLTAQPTVPLGNCRWISGTTAHTQVADTWTEGDVTFESYTLRDDMKYEVWGMAIDGATLYAARLVSKHPDETGNRPGIAGGDTDLIYTPTYFNKPLVFDGQSGLRLQTVGSAGDTSTNGNYLIRQVA
jgi:hypothetical protein